MVLSVVEWERKKWHSNLQHTKRQVLRRCIVVFGRVLSFLKKQERSESMLSVVIPEDVVEEILQQLPVKSLVRFKSVSKRWRSVIDSSHLGVKHLRLCQRKYGDREKNIVFEWAKSGGFQVKTCSKYGKVCSPRGCYCRRRGEEEDSANGVAGSCNGLVCLYDSDTVYLVNPATRRTRRLDPPPPRESGRHSVGFGRDVVTGTYKVVVLYISRVGFDALVFDLGTSEWRLRYESAGPFPSCSAFFALFSTYRRPLFVNGSLFWLETRFVNELNGKEIHGKEILVMDLHTEKVRKIHYPDASLKGFLHIWSLNGRLCASELSKGPCSHAWVLVQDEAIERWERIVPCQFFIPPVSLHSTWFTQTLLSP